MLLLLAAPLFGQPSEGTDLIDMGADVIPSYTQNGLGMPLLDSTLQYSWSIIRAADGSKQFTFTAKKCNYIAYVNDPIFGGTLWTIIPVPVCNPLAESSALTLGPISAALQEFYNYHPNAPHDAPIYNPAPPTTPPNPFAEAVLRPKLSTVTPATPPNPQMIFLDGLTYNLLQFDLTAQKITSTVVVPSTTGPLGIRPVLMGAAHEVWTANGGNQVTVADLTTQAVVTNIMAPAVPQAAPPTGIVFTPDGTMAFEAIGFFSPDSAGNNGALVAFDAVNRKVSSTLLLKNGPTAILMAPDGLTVYLLSPSGQLTYYDVLSGTADLSLSTYTPGLAGGYPGSSAQVFITPDGTHLYWNINYLIVGFDLTTHKISSTLNTGLPSTSPSTMQMSQDGSRIWLTNAGGTVAVYDVPTGGLLGTITADPLSAIYISPVN
ncbi:MAG TPA: hypothetical protein VHW24_22285 [Bryobacteraceae bacterium]|nr:hypothetical protein [Bryobacteraceae bacterium]